MENKMWVTLSETIKLITKQAENLLKEGKAAEYVDYIYYLCDLVETLNVMRDFIGSENMTGALTIEETGKILAKQMGLLNEYCFKTALCNILPKHEIRLMKSLSERIRDMGDLLAMEK